MIGLNKSVLKKSVKKKTVVFDRFAAPNTLQGAETFGITGGQSGGLRSSATLYGRNVYNCDLSQGFLKPGVGSTELVSNAGNKLTGISGIDICKVIRARFRKDNEEIGAEFFLIAREDGYVFHYNEETKKLVVKAGMGKDVNAVLLRSQAGEERYLLCGSGVSRFLTVNGAFNGTTLTNFNCAVCECKSRLFGWEKGGRLIYTNPMEPWVLGSDIDNCGYIRLPSSLGDPIALVSLGEYVYVFFNYAIMRLQVRGSARDFSLETIVYNGGQIMKGSICSISNGLLFLARDGLWKVQGTETQPFGRGLGIVVHADADLCQSAVCKGKYFLRYRADSGGYKSIAVELDGKSWYSSHDLMGLTSANGDALFVREGTVFRLGTEYLPDTEAPLFSSVDVNFGVRGKKILRKITLVGEGTVFLRVTCDARSISRTLRFSDGRVSMDVDMSGNEFSFEVTLINQTRVDGMRAEVEFL